MESLSTTLVLILAAAAVWPRGYLLAYIIDRSKSFSFGFKFFVGWIFGLSAFTIDVFAYNVMGGFSLSIWLFLISAVAQIIGLEFLIYLFEKKLVYPRISDIQIFLNRQRLNYERLSSLSQAILFLIVSCVVAGTIFSFYYSPDYYPYDSRVLKMYEQNTLLIESDAGTSAAIANYPLNDSLFKIWLLTLTNKADSNLFTWLNGFYYILLVGIFYFSLPKGLSSRSRLSTTLIMAVLGLLFFNDGVVYSGLLFSIFLFIALVSLLNYVLGYGSAYFYLSGMALAFSAWTQNEGLISLFPLILATTVFMLSAKMVSTKDFLLSWFFAILTAFPWLTFVFSNQLYISTSEFNAFTLVQLIPLILLIIAYLFHLTQRNYSFNENKTAS